MNEKEFDLMLIYVTALFPFLSFDQSCLNPFVPLGYENRGVKNHAQNIIMHIRIL